MPTLNKTKKETQAILKWGGISLAIIFLFFMGMKFLIFVKDLFTPPPPPEVAFGKLPVIPFPNQIKENIAYSLDTLTGFLPNFSDRAKVYEVISDPPTLLGLNKTLEKVSEIGFKSGGIQIAEDTYQWVDQTASLQRKITMNIFSSDFSLASPYLITPSLEKFSGTDEKNRAIDVAKSFLSKMSLFPKDIDDNKTKTTLYTIEEATLIPTSKISNTKIVGVDFFQKDLDNFPIYYDKGISSTIDFLIGKENGELKVVSARFFHKNISKTASTYAIKTASQAFSELQKGKAYIAYKPANTVEFTIKKVFLGYYIGENQQKFLMPIIVFEGSNDFVAYVSAVRDEWISN
ncbi:MAG: hypothetical protein Q8P29_01325 [Candidatus Levybacteria bacterium]|nr:hypothetical protein [Candidatus Levybacteria bacterium]MDZ4228189.1 hypothetical protein [Candidatus Levybacteria bacterium]